MLVLGTSFWVPGAALGCLWGSLGKGMLTTAEEYKCLKNMSKHRILNNNSRKRHQKQPKRRKNTETAKKSSSKE